MAVELVELHFPIHNRVAASVLVGTVLDREVPVFTRVKVHSSLGFTWHSVEPFEVAARHLEVGSHPVLRPAIVAFSNVLLSRLMGR